MFDLVHSSYALPFLRDQRQAVAAAAALVRPGGLFLLSTAHPLATAEWLEVDEMDTGIFLSDYTHPPADRRAGPRRSGTAVCRPEPLSSTFGYLRNAGLEILRFLEPTAAPEADPANRPPYWSPAWERQRLRLSRIPPVAVFLCRRLENTAPC